jgi:hypothetical protein
MTVCLTSTVRIDSSRNPMLYGNTGGEGVGWVGRYLWYTPHSEKAKLTIPRRTNGTIEKRKRKA